MAGVKPVRRSVALPIIPKPPALTPRTSLTIDLLKS